MSKQKEFLGDPLIQIIKNIEPHKKPVWGKMTLHEMVEHLSDAIKLATKNEHFKLVTNEELLPRMNDFARSEKDFRPETKSPLLGENPLPLRTKSLDEALVYLSKSLNGFHEAFHSDPEKLVLNPIFGDLNYEGQSNLLYKHALHHLRQFGVNI